MCIRDRSTLPTFDGLLRPSESELLLTYLTAPYLRIPLVLRHFADPQRVRALGHRDIQGVLDACFFEPGPWQPPGTVTVPTEVPAPSRAHMAVPAGLLLHELSNAPAPLVDAAEEILALSLELDTGRHDAPCSAGLLYAVRLMTRMHSFIRFLLTESGWGDEVDAEPVDAYADTDWEPAAAAAAANDDDGDDDDVNAAGGDDDEGEEMLGKEEDADDPNDVNDGGEEKAAEKTTAEGDDVDGEEDAAKTTKTKIELKKKTTKKKSLSLIHI